MAARVRKSAVKEAIEHLKNAALAAEMEGAMFHRSGDFPLGPKAVEFTNEVKNATRAYRNDLLAIPIDRALTILEAELADDAGEPVEGA